MLVWIQLNRCTWQKKKNLEIDGNSHEFWTFRNLSGNAEIFTYDMPVISDINSERWKDVRRNSSSTTGKTYPQSSKPWCHTHTNNEWTVCPLVPIYNLNDAFPALYRRKINAGHVNYVWSPVKRRCVVSFAVTVFFLTQMFRCLLLIWRISRHRGLSSRFWSQYLAT